MTITTDKNVAKISNNHTTTTTSVVAVTEVKP